jgi:hypothetical protein
MGWETRRGERYYYRKERDPQTGRVRSIYCGGGERGEQAAREDETRRCSTTVDVANIRHVKKEGESGLMVHAPQPVTDESILTEAQEPPLTHDEIVSRARAPAFAPLVRANLAARSFQTALVFTSITGEEFERRGLAD